MKFKDYGQESVVMGHKGDLFLRLKDGDSATGVFKGEFLEFKKIGWGKDSQEFPVTHSEGSLRFRINFVTPELTAKIWEFGITTYNILKDINAEMPLEKTKVKISRRGSTKENTSYTVIPIGPVSEEGLKKIEGVSLNLLDRSQKSETPLPAIDNSEIPW